MRALAFPLPSSNLFAGATSDVLSKKEAADGDDDDENLHLCLIRSPDVLDTSSDSPDKITFHNRFRGTKRMESGLGGHS